MIFWWSFLLVGVCATRIVTIENVEAHPCNGYISSTTNATFIVQNRIVSLMKLSNIKRKLPFITRLWNWTDIYRKWKLTPTSLVFYLSHLGTQKRVWNSLKKLQFKIVKEEEEEYRQRVTQHITMLATHITKLKTKYEQRSK